MDKHFYVFRHGQTDWNGQKKLQGLTDNPINETGRRQALELIAPVKSARIELLAASTLKRARETASVIADALKIPLITDARLREVDLGEADGMYLEDFREKFGEEFTRRFIGSGDLDMTLPGGESKRAAAARAFQALQAIAAAQKAHRIGVCCHGLIMMLLVRQTGSEEAFPYRNGDLVHLVYSENTLRFVEYIPNPVEGIAIL